MPFALDQLSTIACGKGFTLWHSDSGFDSQHEVCAGNYFRDAAEAFKPGDLIMIGFCGGATIRVVAKSDRSGVITAPLS
jgi:hypothetical protein